MDIIDVYTEGVVSGVRHVSCPCELHFTGRVRELVHGNLTSGHSQSSST